MAVSEYKSVALYVRVSTNKQEVDNQLHSLRDYAVKSNWVIYKQYIDIMSGKETSRPSYDLMFLDAHKKKFSIILFWDMSRFSRAGMYHTVTKLKELENLGIAWHSYNEPMLNTENEMVKNIILAVLSSVAKMEREKISERTKEGLRRIRREGKVKTRGRDRKKRVRRYHKKPL